MTTYIDTSVLLAMFLNEKKTIDAWSWFDRQPINATMVSDWTLVEVASALSVKRRMNLLDDQQHQAVLAQVRRLVQCRFTAITPKDADFFRATELCDRWSSGLRAGDALHVAIAERRNMTLCTLDSVMQDAAVILGMSMEML